MRQLPNSSIALKEPRARLSSATRDDEPLSRRVEIDLPIGDVTVVGQAAIGTSG